MKRIFALLLCLVMAFAVVACDKDGGDNVEGTKNDDKGTQKSSVSFYIDHSSAKIELGGDAKAVITALGTPKSTSPMGNCGGQGTLTKYTYASVAIYVLTSGDKETVDQITLLDDSVKTPENITIGSTKDEVIKACGSAYSKISDSSITYTSGNKNLIIQLRDGAVVGIDYRIL